MIAPSAVLRCPYCQSPHLQPAFTHMSWREALDNGPLACVECGAVEIIEGEAIDLRLATATEITVGWWDGSRNKLQGTEPDNDDDEPPFGNITTFLPGDDDGGPYEL